MYDFADIGFRMPEGLPHKEYAISDGTVSVVLDQSGGINLTEYQGPRRTDGPRRGAFYSNGIWRRELFFPEPVIEFGLSAGDQSIPFRFENLALCPFGVTAQFSSGGIEFGYCVWIRDKAILFEWTATAEAQVSLNVREGFLEHRNDFSQWEEPSFDEQFTALRYNLRRNFTMADQGKTATEHRHEACSMIGCFSPAEHSFAQGTRQLAAALSPAEPCRFAITFGEDVRQVEWLLRDAKRDWTEWLDEQIGRYRALASKTPRFQVAGQPESNPLSEIIRTGPLFVESTRRVKNCCEVALRASTRGYGLWNGWDGQWGCMVLNACDSSDSVPRFLRFLEACRGPNHAIPMVVDYDFGPVHDSNFHTPEMDRELGDGYHINHEMWGLANLHQYYFRSGDRSMLAKLYPSFAQSLRTICANASELGLVGSCFGGADYSDQANRPVFDDKRENCTQTSRLSGVEDMGVLYSGCAQGAELAGLMGDRETLERCVEVMERLHENYLRLYLDEETGYLIDSVWFKDDPVDRNRFFRITSLLALYCYGDFLLLDAIESIARYVKTYLRHPGLGLCDVPNNHPPWPAYNRWDDHWLQNATKESLKLARLAEDRELLDIQVEAFVKHFGADQIIHEDLYYAYEGGKYDPANLYQSTSWWQNMTVHAWWNGLIESVAGLRYERGLLEYVPGDSGRGIALSNLHWGGHRWSMQVSGRGKWIDSLSVNGQERAGTCQMLAAGDGFDQEIVIAKTDRPPEHPVVLSAGASPVKMRRVATGLSEAVIRSTGFVPLHFYSPKEPRVTVNGAPVPVRWCAVRSEGVALLTEEGTLDLVIDCQ